MGPDKAHQENLTLCPILGVIDRSTPFDDPGSELAIPLKVGDYRPQFSWKDALATTFSPRFTIVSPQFHQPIFASVIFQLPTISLDKSNKNKNKPGTHHNSPQTPKTRFIHSKVVGPLLLTLLRRRRPPTPLKKIKSLQRGSLLPTPCR
jgi:hypothetical protein